MNTKVFKKLVYQNGYTMAEYSARLGMSQQRLYAILKDDSVVIKHSERLAKAMGAKQSDILKLTKGTR